MLRPDSADYADILGDVAIGLIAEGGMPAITMRSLAEQFRVTPQRVHSAFGDRAHLERVLMIVFIRRWRAWIARREPRDGVFALLPSTTDEIVWSRVWLALCELARVRDDLSPLVRDLQDEERWVVADALGRSADPCSTDCVLAVVNGLREAMTRADRPLSLDRARAALSWQLRRAEVDQGSRSTSSATGTSEPV